MANNKTAQLAKARIQGSLRSEQAEVGEKTTLQGGKSAVEGVEIDAQLLQAPASYIEQRNEALCADLQKRYRKLSAKTRRDLDALITPIGFDDYLEFIGVIKGLFYYIHDVAPFFPVKGLKDMLVKTISDYLDKKFEGKLEAVVDQLSPEALDALLRAAWENKVDVNDLVGRKSVGLRT